MNIYVRNDITNPANITASKLSDKYFASIKEGTLSNIVVESLLSSENTAEKNQRFQSWTHFIGFLDACLRRESDIYAPDYVLELDAVAEGELEGQRCWMVDVGFIEPDHRETFHFAVPMGASIMSTVLYVLQAVRTKTVKEHDWNYTYAFITAVFDDDALHCLSGVDVAKSVLMTAPNGAAVGTSLAVAAAKAAKSKAFDFFGSDLVADREVGTMSDENFFDYNPAHVLAAFDVTLTFFSTFVGAMAANPFVKECYSLFRKDEIYLNTQGATRLGFAISMLVDFATRVADKRDLVLNEESILSSILHGYAYNVDYHGSTLHFDAGRMIAAAEYATCSPDLTEDEAAMAIQAAVDAEEAAKQHSRELNSLINNINTKSSELLAAVSLMRATAGDEAALALGRSLFGPEFTLEKIGEC